MLNLIGALTPA